MTPSAASALHQGLPPIPHVLPLFNFTGSGGIDPVPVLAGDPAGALYGTTTEGGTNGYGIVYELKYTGNSKNPYTETVLHSFDYTGGALPKAPVAMSSGNLFGTTQFGGTYGYGTVFELVGGTQFQVLYNFKGPPADGAYPASLVALRNGIIYGTTIQGGNGTLCPGGCGAVYALVPGGSESLVYSFQGGTDGWYPWGAVNVPSATTLYGTTLYGGGAGCGGSGCGTVYLLHSVSGNWQETIVHDFAGGQNDGSGPHSHLTIIGGNLFGTTINGGSQNCVDGCGTVFEIAVPSFTESILHEFQGSDGQGPFVGLAQNNTYLYGTTLNGGTGSCAGQLGCGVIFKLLPDGTNFSVVYDFPPPKDQQNPASAVFEDKNTNVMYGIQSDGGKFGYGQFFQVPTPAPTPTPSSRSTF